MNNLKPKLSGSIYDIQRPSFKLGTVQIKNKDGKISDLTKLDRRNGLGNYEIIRRNFEKPAIRPRIAGDFDKLQAIDIETQGTIIQLSDKTIEKLFKVKIPDKTDTQWLAEKARLTALYTARRMTPQEIERELEVNKPLGREQRKLTSNQNIAESSLSTTEKLEEIKQEVVDGRAESRTQQALLIGQLALIFADTQSVVNFTRQQFIDLSQTLARLNISQNRKQIGLDKRYVDIAYYNANQGLVNLYIFSNIASDPNYNRGIDYQTPVYNFATHPATGLPAIGFTSMIAALGRPGPSRRYLDLETRGIISQVQLRSVIALLNKNWDNDDVSVLPANR